MPETPASQRGTVVASTWVPGPCPEPGYGDDDGYAVVWIDGPDGRVQALVDATGRPEPGSSGSFEVRRADGYDVPVFIPADGGLR